MKNINKLLILSIIFCIGIVKSFANTNDDPVQRIVNQYVKVGTQNLNKLIAQNEINDKNSQSNKNVYVFDFQEVVLDPTSPIYVKDYSNRERFITEPYARGTHATGPFIDNINVILQNINNQLTGKPKIYLAYDTYLGFTFREIAVKFDSKVAPTKEQVDLIFKNQNDAVYNTYKTIFDRIVIDPIVNGNTDGIEVISMGFFEKYWLTAANIDQNGLPLISSADAISGTAMYKNFGYYKSGSTPAEKKQFDTDIRPSVFYDLPSSTSLALIKNNNPNVSLPDPQYYDKDAALAYVQKFAENIKEALKGNVAVLNCADYPNVEKLSIVSLTDPQLLANYLKRFRKDCFTKLTLAERQHIFTVIKNADSPLNTYFEDFFEPVNYPDFGGETIANAVLTTTPDGDQKPFLDYIRDNDILMPILEDLADEGFLNREALVGFSIPLIQIAAKKYPFDNNYTKYLDAVTDNESTLNQFQKSNYYWKGLLAEAIKPTKFLPEHISTDPASALSGKFCFNKGIGTDGKLIQKNQYDPYSPFVIVSEQDNLPYADIFIRKVGKFYIVAVPSLYLYVIKKNNISTFNKKLAIGAGGVIGVYSGFGMISTAEAFGMTGGLPIFMGTLEIISSGSTLVWEFTDIKANLKRVLIGRQYTDADAEAFVNNIEKVITVSGIASGGLGLADLTYNVSKMVTFWRINRQFIRQQKLLASTASKSDEVYNQIDELLSPALSRTAGNALEIVSKLDNFRDLKFITTFMRSHLGEAMTDELILALEKGSDALLTKFNQNPELLYKLGDITGLSETGILTRLKSVANGTDEGILKVGTVNTVGGKNVQLFSKIKNESDLSSIKREFDAFGNADKTKFMEDFKDFSDRILKSLNVNPEVNLINSWKVVRDLKSSNKLLTTGSATDLELAAIHTYTYKGDVVLLSMRNGNETIIDAVAFEAYQSKVYELIKSGKAKLILTSRLNTGTVIRGRTYKLQDFVTLFKSGQTNVPLKGLVSTTTELTVAEHFLQLSGANILGPKVKVIMKVKSKYGVYIDDLAEKGENLIYKYANDPNEIRQFEVLLDEGYFKLIGQPKPIVKNGIPKKDLDGTEWFEVELEELGIPLRVIQ
jgi:hypothetical protein